MFRRILLFLSVTSLANGCSFNLNKEVADVGDRSVVFTADTSMTNVELVFELWIDNVQESKVVATDFPWTYNASVSPYKDARFKGYLKYINKEEPCDYIELTAKMTSNNALLDKEFIVNQTVSAGACEEDLKSNTSFSLELESISANINEYSIR